MGPPSLVAEGLHRLVDAGATDIMLDTRSCSAAEVDRTLEQLGEILNKSAR
ncbi:hypothetical protein [Microbacterium sp.]|uniref:hypothetical protein n=1 Tax=Microbacterium sp. TaxID=51671 RepID=UPI003A943B34